MLKKQEDMMIEMLKQGKVLESQDRVLESQDVVLAEQTKMLRAEVPRSTNTSTEQGPATDVL